MQNNISRTETDILKGVAIIMMLWLHLFLKESDIGNYSDLHFANGLSLSYYLTRLCTPVSFFLILSGYGLAYLYNENRLSPRTQLPRLLKTLHTLLVGVACVCSHWSICKARTLSRLANRFFAQCVILEA